MAGFLIGGSMGIGGLLGAAVSGLASLFTSIDFETGLVIFWSGVAIGGTIGYAIAVHTGLITLSPINAEELTRRQILHDYAVNQYNRDMDNYRLGLIARPTFGGARF